MVEAVDVGDAISFRDEGGKGDIKGEYLTNANLLCVNPQEIASFPDDNENKEGVKGHMVYGIYGNDKVASSFIPASELSAFLRDYRTRILLVKTKPYILNGVRCGDPIHYALLRYHI